MFKKKPPPWSGVLLFLAGSLKTGLSLDQSLEALLEQVPEPLYTELNARLGPGGRSLPVADKIERILPGASLAPARAALHLSHRAGGQAGALLEISALQLQEKLELAEKVQALSAQSRASAWVVGLSPLGLILLMSVFAPDYIAPLFSTRAGALLLGLAALLVSVGLWMVQRMSRIEM